MRAVHLAAGAAGMYCGSCMHDNRLAAALRAKGRDVVLLPLYTPLRTDEVDVSAREVYYGGINVYLQQASGFFRRTPRFVDRFFDTPALLRGVGRLAARTRPEALGEMTLAILQGEDGPQRKELARLIGGLRELKPDVVYLPNLMFVGLARSVKRALHVPVMCGLTGEDIFLDNLPAPQRERVFALLRARAADVDAFIALTAYYARHAAEHFGLPVERVQRIPMGIHTADFNHAEAPPVTPFTIGYLARVCPEKGLDELGHALTWLRQQGRTCRVRAAGYLGAAERPFLQRLRAELRAGGVADGEFEYVGELSRIDKIQFLRSLHVLCVPTRYAESKGFYVLEALAAGVPVVKPAHGAFPELIAATGGGLLYEPGHTQGLVDALARLMDDATLRAQLGARGQAAVHADFTADGMATAAWRLFEGLVAGR